MTETMQTIKDLMKHQHISQRSMAEKVGVTEATMSRWINGTRNPDIQYVERMIKILSYKLSYGDMEKRGRWIKCIDETAITGWTNGYIGTDYEEFTRMMAVGMLGLLDGKLRRKKNDPHTL